MTVGTSRRPRGVHRLLAVGLMATLPVGLFGPASALIDDETDVGIVLDDEIILDDESGVPGAPAEIVTRERRPLVEVPRGCVESPLPDVVFVGRVVERDFRTARFRIGQVRAGDPAPFSSDGLIDVRYGLDVQYLHDGDRYLVAARRDPVLGILASRLRPEPPMFGGDDVVSLVETEIECPGFEDPAVTLHPDGRVVETSLLAPLFEQRTQLAAAVLLPVGVAFAVVFALAMLRVSLAGVARGVGSATTRVRDRRR